MIAQITSFSFSAFGLFIVLKYMAKIRPPQNKEVKRSPLSDKTAKEFLRSLYRK